MESPLAVTIPLLNPNEPEALISALHVHEGQQVEAGDPLCTLETTKSAVDLEAEQAGRVVGLHFEAGQNIRAGETLCYISNSPGWSPPEAPLGSGEKTPDDELPPGLRITNPALALAREAGLDFTRLPAGPLITEAAVKDLLARNEPAGRAGPDFSAPQGEFDPGRLVVYGGGGYGKMVIELIRALGAYQIEGVIDDGIGPGETVLGVPVLGGGEALTGLYARGVRLAVNAVGGVGNVTVRIRVFHRLAEAGFACPALVHPTAFLEPSAQIAAGVQVQAMAYVGADARVGFGAIVNTGAVVSHDCRLGNYANLAPGALLAGEVQVGDGALVGMGTTVHLQTRIGPGARIGSGATIKSDVPENAVVQAGAVWPANM